MKKRLSMLKLLSILSLLIINLNATTIKHKITSYEEHRLSANPNLAVNSIKLIFTKKLSNNWTGFVFDLDLTIVNQNKDIKVKDMLFSNGKLVTSELKTLKGFDMKRKMHPKLDKRYYQDSHLIAGDKNAKHKLVLFSDPLCPICTEDTPTIIKDVQEHPHTFALYYVSFPLDMHPTAKLIAKAAMIAGEQGIRNIDYKVYTAKFEKFFDAYRNKNNQKSLDAFNKVLNTHITMAQINDKELQKMQNADIKLAEDALVNGTPTLFLDGEIDLTRSEYKKYIK